jgi:hypothetical protein
VLNPKSRYQPNAENVSAKVLDGEAVLIHVTRGTYHSLERVGCRVWELIEKRYALEGIASAIATQYEVGADSAQKDIAKFIDALLQEDLVLEATDAAVSLDLQKSTKRLPYDAPILNTYHDMSDLLALDPPMPGLQAAPRSDSEEK